jgi:type IV pilus assembly protein PilC
MSVVDSDRAARAFAYEAQSLTGERFNGTLEARSAEEVQERLSALQLRVLTIGPAEAPKVQKGALGADEFLIFNQQLAHLTEAGLPVEKGLRLIAIDLRSGRLARAAQDVAAELERGDTLQNAFARHAAQFPPLYGQLVEAGAAAGNLPGMLFNLGRHLELVGRLRRCLWRTLAYPVGVLAALSLVGLFVSIFVLPQFENIYSGFRVTLPWVTLAMMGIAHIYPWVFAFGWGLVLLITIGDVIARLVGSRGIPWLGILTYVPLLGAILKANLLARWLDALRLAIESGLDLPRALTLAANATSDAALIRDAALITQQLQAGHPLDGFATARVPATVTAAIELTSNTGSGPELPHIIYSLSHMYEQQAEHRLRILPSILTPLLLILIAGGVGTTIAAMFLPMVRLIQAVSGGEG